MSTSDVLDTTDLGPEAAEEVRAFVDRSRASVAHETERVDDDDNPSCDASEGDGYLNEIWDCPYFNENVKTPDPLNEGKYVTSDGLAAGVLHRRAALRIISSGTTTPSRRFVMSLRSPIMVFVYAWV